MEGLKFSYKKTALISSKELLKLENKIHPEILKMNLAARKEYSDVRASINLPLDEEMVQSVKRLVKVKQNLKPEYLVVVGIGGSNLGTKAIQEAVLGKMYNQLNPKLKILYADTVDTDDMKAVLVLVEDALKRRKNVIINGISKSGGTTETIANFELLVNLVKKHKKDYNKFVVVTSDKGSKLWDWGMDKGFDTLEIPKMVGGRYSVLSPVGLFPLGMIGLNLEKLHAGALMIRKVCLRPFNKNPAAVGAALLYLHNQKKINMNVLFMFNKDFESLGKWNRQLMAETIGKEFNKKKRRVYTGMTPLVSIGSTDLHSMAQLYLGGPHDKFVTFMNVEKERSNVKLPKIKEYDNLVSDIQGKSLKDIMNAIYKGTKLAFAKNHRPFCEITFPDKSEHSIGQFLQFKIMEIMYLSQLLEIDPFNQPKVEDYKVETKRLLSGGKK